MHTLNEDLCTFMIIFRLIVLRISDKTVEKINNWSSRHIRTSGGQVSLIASYVLQCLLHHFRETNALFVQELYAILYVVSSRKK